MLEGNQHRGELSSGIAAAQPSANSMEMRAAVLQKDRSVTIDSVPVPKLLPRSVRVKVLAVQMAPYTTDVVSGAMNDLLRLFLRMCELRSDMDDTLHCRKAEL